ncbi:hypothetical protein HL666_20065 [Bradyrhizobium sp. 83002]|uniref:hypothetical protein n=1 Tax=Bradyrhizobium aeschynomenes TaxID=2734909 RepID=UPI00155317DE|nr:hypothetical protein [Bradyrhizobium aeschynomenes]NPU13069.1 hypothetical protein [Bradyrhizobium aeschynomenes]
MMAAKSKRPLLIKSPILMMAALIMLGTSLLPAHLAFAQTSSNTTLADLRTAKLSAEEAPRVLKSGNQFKPLSARLSRTLEYFQVAKGLGGVPLNAMILRSCWWNDPLATRIDMKCSNDQSEKRDSVIPVLVLGSTSPQTPQLELIPTVGSYSGAISLNQYAVEVDGNPAESFWIKLSIDTETIRRRNIPPVALVVCTSRCSGNSSLLELTGGQLPPSGILQQTARSQEMSPRLRESRPPGVSDAVPGSTSQSAGGSTISAPSSSSVQELGQRRSAAAVRSGALTGARPSQVDIEISIDGVPADYDEPKLKRLLISAVDGAVNATDILGIEIVGRSGDATRASRLSITPEARDLIRIAGKPIDCGSGVCTSKVTLRTWYLDASAIGLSERLQFASGAIIASAGGWSKLFQRLGVDDKYLPELSVVGRSRLYRLYLPDAAILRVNILPSQKNDQAPSIITPSMPQKRGMKLVKRSDSRYALEQADDVDAPIDGELVATNPSVASSQSPVAAQSVAVQSAIMAHFVIRPDASGGQDPQRSAQRLLELVRKSKAFVILGDTKLASKSDRPELTKSKDGVVAWSGDITGSAGELVFEPPLAGVRFVSAQVRTTAETASSLVDRQRINARDQVNEKIAKIEDAYRFDSWVIQIEPFARIYLDRPDTSNNECEFLLVSPGGMQEGIPLLSTTLGGKRVLRSSVLQSAKLNVESGLQFVVRPFSGAANCAPSRSDLVPFNPTEGWSLVPEIVPSLGEIGVLTKKVPIRMRGRWLLGLYAPQDIGVTAGSANLVEDTKDQIFRHLTTFLDKARDQYFPSSSAMNMAVGYDLAAMSSVEPLTYGFPESAVITGQFRNPKPASQSVRLDREGDRRYSAFIDTASTASAPTFEAVGRMIQRYSKLFDLSDERSSVAIYVGAGSPTSRSCPEWKEMTEGVARMSGKPIVFGIIFAHVSSLRIQNDLGPGTREEILATRTKAYSCGGVNQSTVLFVPFPDLLDRDPATVLEAAFAKVGTWVAQQSN